MEKHNTNGSRGRIPGTETLSIHLPTATLFKDAARFRPIIFVHFGVLGDLSVSRLNHEIFNYYNIASEHPFEEVYMCDITRTSTDEKFEMVARMYDLCRRHDCLDKYFIKGFVEYMADAADQVEKFVRNWKGGEKLSGVGKFLFEHYRCTKTPQEQQALLRTLEPSSHVIFYLAVDPAFYGKIIATIAKWLHPDRLGRTMVIVEKPFQKSKEEAWKLKEDIAATLTEIRTQRDRDPLFNVFAVDHYATKPVLSKIPIFLDAFKEFREFVANVDCIVIELLETHDIPEHRLGYMATTGLLKDMMPHALVPLQLLFAGQKVQFTVDALAEGTPAVVGTYKGYSETVRSWLQGADAQVRYDTYFSFKIMLEVLRPSGEVQKVEVFIRSGKAMCADSKWMRLSCRQDGPWRGKSIQFDITTGKIDDPGVMPHHALNERALGAEIKGYARVIYSVVQHVSTMRDGEDNSPENPILLSPESAANVIAAIHAIEEGLQGIVGRNGFSSVDAMKVYDKGDLFVDEKAEAVFRFPKLDDQRTADAAKAGRAAAPPPSRRRPRP